MKNRYDDFAKAVKNKKVSVVGIDASNAALIPFLVKAGAVVTVYSDAPRESMGECLFELENSRVTLVCGENCLEALSGDIIICGSLPLDRKTERRVKDSGARLTSEAELFLEYCPCEIITPTDSVDKAYADLKKTGSPVYLCGDGYPPLLSRLDTIDKDGKVLVVNQDSTVKKAPRYRAELVHTANGVQFYNDSFSTTPARTVATLRAFYQNVILIAGGYDKGYCFSELAREIKARVKTLVLTGDSAERIYDAAGALVKTVVASSLEAALQTAVKYAEKGDAVLYSPACPSFDCFDNFVERGNRFTTLVKTISERKIK